MNEGAGDPAAPTTKRRRNPSWDWLGTKDAEFEAVRQERSDKVWRATDPALGVGYREMIATVVLATRGMSNHCETHLRYAFRGGLSLRMILEWIEAAAVAGGSPVFADLVPILMKIEQDGGFGAGADQSPAAESTPQAATARRERDPNLEWLARKDPVFFESQMKFVDMGWNRPNPTLPVRYCELAKAVVLAVRAMPSEMVERHLRNALAAGMTEQELYEGMQTAAVPGGWPVLVSALPILMRLEKEQRKAP